MPWMPFELSKLSGRELDAAILMTGIMAELEAVNLYVQLAAMAGSEAVREVLLDIAREEKTHIGEFLTLLKTIDEELARELERGSEEVRELMEKLRG